MSHVDELRRARVYLSRLAEPGHRGVILDFIAEHGALQAAELLQRAHAPQPVLELTAAARRSSDRAQPDLGLAERLGARLVIPEDVDEWPADALEGLEDKPIALWVRSPHSLARLTDHAVAIIGARAATSYGEHQASEFAYHIASKGNPVWSGGAYGIDGAAHKAALSANGCTVAVLACGIDLAYPAGHARLLGEIAERGALLTEYSPGTRPARQRFLARNRIVAACARVTLIVEAGKRSGSRHTANAAFTLGRDLMAVPGPVTSAMSMGCHDLIQLGKAQLVQRPEEVLTVLNGLDS